MSERECTVRAIASVIVVAAALAGCSIGPKATEQPASYDLGPPRQLAAGNPPITAMLALPEVTAPAWLGGNGIVYRLSFENAARAYAYTQSRWTAPPPALLTQRMRSRFAASTSSGIATGTDGVRADYLLRVELEDFSQSFESPASSRVALRARASLVNLANRNMVAQRVFDVEQATPTPDAPGAVKALAAASDEFMDRLLAWTAERLKAEKPR